MNAAIPTCARCGEIILHAGILATAPMARASRGKVRAGERLHADCAADLVPSPPRETTHER